MFVYAADVAQAVTTSGRFGIDATLDGVRWTDIRDRIFGRIDPISAAGRHYRVHGANTTAFLGHARFTGPRSLEVSTGDTLTADQVVIAAGGHPVVPEVVARSGVPFHTSDTVMRIEDLPERMVILGGGYIAAEFAHVFSALGVRGHPRRARQPAAAPPRLRGRATGSPSSPADAGTCGWAPRWSAATGDDLAVRLDLADGSTVDTDLLLVATGRVPNTATWGWRSPGSRPTPTAASRSTATAARTWTGSGRSVTSRRRTSSSTSPTTRHGSWPTTWSTPRACARWTTATSRQPSSPTRRSRAWAAPRTRSARSASPTSAPPRRTATRRTAGRWRTPPASASWSPTRARGGCSAPTSWGRRRPA